MKKIKYEKKKKLKYKIKREEKYETLNFPYKKILFIIALFIFFFTKTFERKLKKVINIQKFEEIELSSLSPKEHYKILFPKVKYHTYPKINPKDEINLFKLEDSSDYQKMKEKGKDNYIYYSCAITKAKHENLYVREYVEHYLNLGIEKFYFGDDNEENIENLSDVLDDYIKKGIVDVEYIFDRNMTQYDFFEYAYRSVKLRCKWYFLFDVDEFFEFTDKNMSIKEYLEMPVFNKCDVIRIHFLLYDDNNLIYYDNRPLKERFNHSVPNNKLNIYHKSILRGKNYNGTLFSGFQHVHQPNDNITTQCDALGNIEKRMGRAKYKYCFLRHYSYKTSEEFAVKLLRGRHQSEKYKMDMLMDYFFKLNNLTEEKLNLIESIVNRTFPKFHKSKK